MRRKTGPITWATATEVAGVMLLLVAGTKLLDLPGAVAACLALLGGRAAGVALLLALGRR